VRAQTSPKVNVSHGFAMRHAECPADAGPPDYL
jgi:hypothetical protein